MVQKFAAQGEGQHFPPEGPQNENRNCETDASITSTQIVKPISSASKVAASRRRRQTPVRLVNARSDGLARLVNGHHQARLPFPTPHTLIRKLLLLHRTA